MRLTGTILLGCVLALLTAPAALAVNLPPDFAMLTVGDSIAFEKPVALAFAPDGRIGTFRGIRKGKSGYGGTAYTSKAVQAIGTYQGYRPLVVQIAQFFRSQQPPIEAAETIELYAFMQAADESKRQGGAPVLIADVMQQAQDNLKSSAP